jgi:RNA polymerase sigma-70 factor, ECF subfamily
MSTIGNDDLIPLAVAGDGAAIATLLQAAEPRLQTYVSRRLPRAVQTTVSPEDVVQETCYEACRLIRGFVPRGSNSFDRWVIRIANFRIQAAIQKYRSRQTYTISAASEDDASMLGAIEQLVVYRRTPSASAAAHEFIFAIERALDRLIPAYRQVITDRFINGFTVDETANRMHKTPNQVYVLSSRALGALRVQLKSASRFA